MTRTFTNYSKILATLLIGVVCCWNVAYAQIETFDGEALCENTAFAPADNGDCPLSGTWSQDGGDDWDFSVNNSTTGSGGTGPSFDHTVGDGATGNYLFCETSGSGSSSTFTLNGPAGGYDLDAIGAPAFQVWYHAFGADLATAEIHLEVSTDGGTTYTSELSIVDPVSEDLWKEATVLLTAFSGTVHLRIRIVTGGGFGSDIGIDDVGVIDASAPNATLDGASITGSACNFSDAETVTITVTNSSATDIAAGELEATFELMGPIATGPVTEALPAILSGQTIDYTFTATADLSSPGSYDFDGSVDFSAASGLVDSNPNDNTIGGGVDVLASFGMIDAENPAYMESFEADEGGWNVVDVGGNASTMTLGTPPAGQTNINSASDGTQAWYHDTNDANTDGEFYNSNEAIFFLSGCYDLSCMATGTFSIDVNYDAEANWDGASIGYSTDEGATFVQLGEGDDGTSNGNGMNWYNDPDVASQDVFGLTDAPGWSGTSGGWQTATHSLDMLAGESNVLFAVVFTADGSGQIGEGFAWDNIQVTGDTTDPNCFGCADIGACNYDGSPYDDGTTCEYTSCAGCMDAGACNYDAAATIDDGSCDYSCLGCTDMTACNYDAAATIDDGSCAFGSCGDGVCDLECGEDVTGCVDCAGTVPGCMDAGACNYNPDATVDDGSCEYMSCAGCMDMNACNYDATATIDDGSCVIGSCGNGICETVCGETVANCTDCAIRFGCTDEDAHNYSPRATDDDGSCETCDDGYLNGDEVAVDCGGALCEPCVLGCMDPDAHNYDVAVDVDDGSCETCDDGIMNGDEDGVDCGGSNPNCGICGDLCINALDIACGDTVTGDTNDNTNADIAQNCGVGSPDAGAWYTFEGTGENVVLSTDHAGTFADTNLQVYSGDCDNLTCVAWNEDGNQDIAQYSSDVTVTTMENTTYYIYVSGWNGDQEAYELTMDCFFPINITLNGASQIPASGVGTASISVTVTGGNTDCGPLTFSWTGPGGYTASTEDATGITVDGDYTLTVTDCLGNEETLVVEIEKQTRRRGRRKAAIVATTELTATPNPFASATTISFEINTEEQVSLDVYDIRGAKVANLFDGTTEAGQNYQVQFGQAMPSGTYIAKLTTSTGEVQHIKLFLTK